MISWVAYFSVGVIIGIGAGFYFSILNGSERKRLQELEAKLKDAENNMSGYKQNVADHFVTTSNLINNMTESYRAIYDHMSDGAKTLCHQSLLDSPASQYQLGIPKASPIETKTKSPDSATTDSTTADSTTADSTTTNSTTKSTASTRAVNPPISNIPDTSKTDASNIKSENTLNNKEINNKEINKTEIAANDSATADKNSASNISANSIANDTTNDETTKLTKESKESNAATISLGSAHGIDGTTTDKEQKKPLLYEKSKKQNSNVIH